MFDMNAKATIKELRKPGKVAITLGGTEIEVFADKADLIEQVAAFEAGLWNLHDRGSYRLLIFSGEW
jgi:MoaA/NifB/PqqE/SkfB family radical SAM enzyme